MTSAPYGAASCSSTIPVKSEPGEGRYDGPMRIRFVAGFGPIVRDLDQARAFWERGLGIELEEAAPDYFTNDDLEGVRAFALWPLSQAAQACFGSPEWPADRPTPQAWLEFDLGSEAEVFEAATELEGKGLAVLVPPRKEEWGQTTCRLLSPEGLLVGATYTPWMHQQAEENGG